MAAGSIWGIDAERNVIERQLQTRREEHGASAVAEKE